MFRAVGGRGVSWRPPVQPCLAVSSCPRPAAPRARRRTRRPEGGVAGAATRRRFKLQKGQQLLIEGEPGSHASFKLKEGSAELYGAEISAHEAVRISEERLAVFTWTGCRIDVVGEAHCSCCESAEAQMAAYLGVHDRLNRQRAAAAAGGGRGGRTMVIGPKHAGKNGLVRTLAGYARRSGWAPVLVDLDVGQGEVLPPGTLGATRAGLSSSVAQRGRQQQQKEEAALMYFYGHTSPAHSPKHYRFLVRRLADALDKRGRQDGDAAGMLINTSGWVRGLGLKLLLHSISALRVDTVVVVGDEQLRAHLAQRFAAGGRVEVVGLRRPPGKLYRTQAARGRARAARLRRYFYGAGGDRVPQRRTVSWAELEGRVFRVGFGPADTLPAGHHSVARSLGAWPLRPGNGIDASLRHSVLGVSRAEGPSGLLLAGAAGLVYVAEVDSAAQTLTFLSRGPLGPAGRLLLAGDVGCGPL
eukprot:jgi/Tetstr1/429327/TSEL_019245.t1